LKFRIAAASFSLYLTHKAAFHVTRHLFGEALEGRGVMAFVAYAAAAVVVGAVLHHAVERPFLKLRRRFVRKSESEDAAGHAHVIHAQAPNRQR
ncbi:MAG: hypothetical protein ABI858_08820, partial [Pseudoxanthomonas sp.]